MIKYSSSVGEKLIVELDSDSPNKSGKVTYIGDKTTVDGLKLIVAESYGAFGHSLDPDSMTPIDLDSVLNDRKEFGFSILEGAEIVKSYDPEIPEDAVT